MNLVLDVYLSDALTGRLTQDSHGLMTFEYDTSWIEDPDSMPLSHSMPLRHGVYVRAECAGFFAGILPEQNKLTLVAKNLGVSANNVFALLNRIGGDCAGAAVFVPAGTGLPSCSGEGRRLDDARLAQLLTALPSRPLMAGEAGVRFSLAGVQDKLAVSIVDGAIFLPHEALPSTHILKPAIKEYPNVVQNEAFCMRLARAVGINAAHVEVGRAGCVDYLCVERYDRSIGPNGLRREHQEDFCQALCVAPERKYQAEGGPSLKQCFGLLREASTSAVLDLQALLDAVTFNCLIGNHDAHGKNFSLLYPRGAPGVRTARLAPLYDLICTVRYENISGTMAMKLGGEYDSAKLRPVHFDRFSDEVGLAKPLVRQRVIQLVEATMKGVESACADLPEAVPVAEAVQARCKAMRARFKGSA